MPAQLILLAKDVHERGDEKDQKQEEKIASEASPGSPGSGKRRFPPHRKIPVGVLNVVGQDLDDIGSFANLDELLERARSYEISPNRSNTIFGSVRSIAGLDADSSLNALHGRLNQLPNQLTIIVQEEKRRA